MEKRKVIFGLLLVFFGLLLLGRSLDIIDFTLREISRFFWPAVIIAIGVWLVVRRRGPKVTVDYYSTKSGKAYVWQAGGGQKAGPVPPPGLDPQQAVPPNFIHSEPPVQDSASSSRSSESPSFSSEGRVKYGKTLGDLFIECDGVDLRSVEVSGGLGDIEIRLRGGKLSHGLNRLVISSMVGDVRVTVPRTMAWFAQASNFVGDVEIGEKRTDGFGNRLEGQSPDYSTAQSKLYIAINSFIGDVRVHSV
jgi:lia operon protein LiaF